ncbi:MAG: transposase [Clostridiales bacterium]|nr:transposase [Clostridiales bacterium]
MFYPRFLRAFANWRCYILNVFDIHLSNGFTGGCNNAIKILKRLAFSFRSFSTFRARILLASCAHPYI